MTEEEIKKALKRFEEHLQNLPDQLVIKGGGVYGEDIVCKKKYINGVPVHSGPLDVPCWGGGERKTCSQ